MQPPRTLGPRVVVVGAVNVDLVVAADRLPGPGETVVGPRLARHGGGKGANAAVAAARAGAAVTLVGAVGRDDDGSRALQELSAEGVEVSTVAVLDSEPTGVALIVVDPAGENQIAVGAGANAALTPDHVVRALATCLPDAGCVLVSTEIPAQAVVAAVQAASRAGVPCVLNPAPPLPELVSVLHHGPLLTPNATESVLLADLLGADRADTALAPRTGGAFVPATDNALDQSPDALPAAAAGVVGAARALAARTANLVIVTLGGDGLLLCHAEGAVEHVPARPTTVRDTTGAGDTFNGVLAAELAAGRPAARAVRVASAAAGLSVAHIGARAGMPDGRALQDLG